MTTWSCTETSAFDLHLQQDCGIPAALLMENAGNALGRLALDCAREEDCRGILVVAGPGNNGGDGLVAARHLAHTLPLSVVAPLGLPRLEPKNPAGLALQGARGLGIPFLDHLPGQSAPLGTLVIDALLGTGLSRPLAGAAAESVAWMNRSGGPILAVDIPSGLDGDTGRILGTAVKAAWTLSFVGRKHGFGRSDGPSCCGRIQVAGIGVSQAYATAWLERFRAAGEPTTGSPPPTRSA